MLERKEHKKMYKSGKNWAVVTLSTAALVLGASSVTASANTETETNNNNTDTVQVTTEDSNVNVKSINFNGGGQTAASSDSVVSTKDSAVASTAVNSTSASTKATAQASDASSSSASSASSSDSKGAVASASSSTDKKSAAAKAATSANNNEEKVTDNAEKQAKSASEEGKKADDNAAKLNKNAAAVVKNAGVDPASLTADQIKALNKVNFSKRARTSAQMTYLDFQKIADTLIKQDPRYAVPFFNASQIKNMPAATTRDAQTGIVQPLDVWDSWPVQDATTGYVTNWNGYQLAVAMMGVPNTNDNHIYLLYNKYGDNNLADWKNAGPIFGFNADALTQQWSGSATVNSDGSIQLFYTKVDTSDNNSNHQKIATATLYLNHDDNTVSIAKVENDHVVFEGDGWHYQTYAQWRATNRGADNIAMRDAHIVKDNEGNRYLVFEASTGLSDYQGPEQIFNWSNYGGDDHFNYNSFIRLLDNKDMNSRASWANAAIGIIKLNNDEKNPQVEEVMSPLLTANMVSDEIERPDVVKLGDKYYLFAATRLNRGSNDDAWMKANYNVGDNVAMVGYVSDNLTSGFKPLNDSGVVLTASVPANWRTATYSYYAVPVEGKDNQVLITSYITNRNGVAGENMDSTWAPSFLLQINPDNTTTVLAKMTNQGDWIWDDSSENLSMLGDLDSAALPGEREKPVDWDLIGYGLKDHDPEKAPQDQPKQPGTPETPTTPEKPGTPNTPGTPETPKTPETPTTPTTPEKPGTPYDPAQPARLPQTGNASAKAAMGLGAATLLAMFGLAGANKRRYY